MNRTGGVEQQRIDRLTAIMGHVKAALEFTRLELERATEMVAHAQQPEPSDALIEVEMRWRERRKLTAEHDAREKARHDRRDAMTTTPAQTIGWLR